MTVNDQAAVQGRAVRTAGFSPLAGGRVPLAALAPARGFQRRAALLCSTAATLLMIGAAPAMAACVGTGASLDCSGDLSAGVVAGPPYDTLNISKVTSDIAPPAATDGISFKVNGPITLTVDTGSFAVSVTGHDVDNVPANGVTAQSYDGSSVGIFYKGDIASSEGDGIFASGLGDVSETGTGNITAGLDAIHLESYQSLGGTITIDHTGNLSSTGGDGIFASTQGSISEKSSGTISTEGDGIHLKGYDVGDIGLDHTGGITSSGGYGVWVDTQGIVNVNVDGDVSGQTDAIYARSSGPGKSVTVTHTGTLNSGSAAGIEAVSPNGPVSVTNNGDIVASSDGINATSNTNAAVSVSQTGHISANRGIVAYSSSGTVDVTATGDIDSAGTSVAASSAGDDVAVTQTGYLNSTGGEALVLSSSIGNVSLSGAGAVTAHGTAIDLSAYGPRGAITVNRSGAITSATGTGILAHAGDGSVYVTNAGTITASGRAIDATSTGSVADAKVWQTGNVSSSTAEGIHAAAANGAAVVNVWGNVDAQGTGILAQNSGGSYLVDPNTNQVIDTFEVTVNGYGNVTSADGYGIYARSPNGAVTVTTHGNVTTHGASSSDAGIYAANTASPDTPVSVNAGGDVTSDHGDAIEASSTAANVSVVTNGTIKGGRSGISIAGQGGQLSAEVDGGSVSGTDGPAISFTGQGGTATLLNRGTISNTNGINGDAIVTSQVETTVDNYGTITGNVTFSPWTGSFLNEAGGQLNLGNSIDLGNLGNLLQNFGTVSVGGIGNIASTTLNGSFKNELSGVIVEDIDPVNGTGDLLHVNGEANLSGTLKLNLTSVSTTQSPIEFLTADQWINTEGILANANAALDATVSYSYDNKTAYVSIDGIDFAPAGVTGPAADIGRYLNAAIINNPTLAPIGVGLVNLGTTDQLTEALNQLSPTVYGANESSTNINNIGFVNRLFSCKVADGPDPFNAEGDCSWVRTDYGLTNHAGASDGSGFAARTFNISGGRQGSLGKDLRLDIGGGLVSSSLATDNGGTSSGTTAQVGAALKYVPGQALLAASLAGSFGWFQNQRPLSFGGFTDTLTGDSQVATLEGRLRAAYTFQSGNYYARPQIDLDAAYTHSGAVDETGAVAAMHIDAADALALSVTPAFEIGGQTVLDDDSIFRPYVRGGATIYANPNTTTTGHLVADSSGESFTTVATSDPVQWNIEAGFDLLRSGGPTWRAYYNASFGQSTTAQAGGLKLSFSY